MIQAILHAVRDAVFVADIPTGMILDANPAAEVLCGRRVAELRSMHYSRLYPPGAVETAKNAFQNDPHCQGLWESAIVHKDGHAIPVEISASRYVTVDGRQVLVGVFRDTTERNAARDALRQSEERFRQVAESAGEFIWETDTEGLYTYASPVVQEILGYTPAEVVGKMHFYDLFVPETRAAVKKAAFEVFARQERFRAFLNWNLRKDGTAVLLETSGLPVTDRYGKLLGYRGTDTDATARRVAEDQLRLTLESIGDGFFACDAHWRFVYLNAEAERALGIRREEALGRSFWEVFPLTPGTSVEHEYRRAEGGDAQDFECFFVPSGRWFHNRCFPREGGGVCVYFQDITARKQAEAALYERESLLHAITETASDPIFVNDRDSRILMANPATLAAWNMREDQVLGKTAPELCNDPEDGRRLMAADRKVIESGQTQIVEELIPGLAGSRLFLTSKTPYRDAEGQIVGVIGIAHDITDRRRAEEALRESEERFRGLFENATVGIYRTTPEGRIEMANPALVRMLGYDSFSALSETNLEEGGFEPKQQRSAFRKAIEKENYVRGREAAWTRRDGSVLVVRESARCVRDEAGKVRFYEGVVEDITEQVNARELLCESERCLSNAERIAQIGNWRWDIKSKRVVWSEGLLRIFGNPRDAEPGYELFMKTVAEQDRERVAQWVIDRLAGHGDKSLEFQIVHPDGELRAVVSVVEVAFGDDGLPTHVSGTCQDVTDARRAQVESSARQKFESLGTLAGGIAHDFNNLMGGVLAQAELAMAGREAGIFPLEELNEIQNVAIRGSKIVRQLMIYAGQENDVPELVDLSKAVDDIRVLLEVTASKRAALVIDLAANLPPVKARAAQLQQIIMNLVSNASDAIKGPDGVIRVSTALPARLQDTVWEVQEGLPEGDWVQLEVSDTGRGMSRETQARIFDPFFTTKSPGRGLGLAVVRGIVRSLHGAIQVMTETGKGTTFRILLPCEGAEIRPSAEPAVTAAQTVDCSRTANVLYVEDEDTLRLAVTKMLGKEGFGVIEAANGFDAIELLRTRASELDVVLLDMTIPGVPSSEVLAAAVRARPEVKVIPISAYSKEMVMASLSAPQIRGYVRKPFQLTDLVNTIRSALSA